MLFQDALLQPWLTARASVELPGKIGGFRVDARDLLASMGLKDRENAYPRELSGGMKRRVALARALAQEPDLLLLDEPYTGLDEITAARMYELLAHVVAQRRLGVLLVTHSVHEAVRIASRVLVLSGEPATVRSEVLIGAPEQQRRQQVEQEIREALLNDPEFSA
jgi:NitT/TauT family transport system ATP-binding protein